VQLAKLAAIETVNGTAADVGAALASYTELFGNLFYVGLAFAALLLLVSPLLKKMMHGIR
jgi:POT family proton-dependent oligopeptide transporter